MKHPYEDILHLPHHVSEKHPQMPLMSRAAQFSPFAALTGYEAAIGETARLTEEKLTLDEDAMQVIGERLAWLSAHLREAPAVTVTYFVPDARKAGGAYRTRRASIKKIDGLAGVLIPTDGPAIPFDDIYSLELSGQEEQHAPDSAF